ncbi:hypothetical protein A2U01_0066572, partial [Trifolium medium]|nr:hypothetical protein [Trifolium medium]
PWILETMVGDETAVIVLKTTGRMNKRIRSFEGKMIKLKNAKIELYKNSMRLMVNSEGDIEPSQAAEFIVKQDNNVSLLEWERVDVVI